MVDQYAHNPQEFKLLPLEEQLAIIADITYYCAAQKIEELKKAKKTRTDSCIEALEWYEKEKYWMNLNMNIKRLAELEVAKIRAGI